jgi:hypothetical protein
LEGQRIESVDHFKKALELDPDIRITQDEVLDESVIAFFEAMERPKKREKKEKKTEKIFLIRETAKAPTEILVTSNQKKARVRLDGDTDFGLNKKIPISPGEHKITVYAPGYEPQERTILADAYTLSQFHVDIKKIENKTATPKVEKNILVKIPKDTSPSLAYLMPFGYGQYKQNNLNWGIFYTISQTAALGFGIYQYMDAQSIVDETESVRSQITDRNEELAYKSAQDKKSNSAQLYGHISLLGFFSLWAISSYTAFQHEDKDKKINLSFISDENQISLALRFSFK